MKPERSALVAETVSVAVADLSLAQSAVGGGEGWLSLCTEVRQLVDSVMFRHGGVPMNGRHSAHEFAYAFSRASTAVEALVELQRDCLRPAPDQGGVSLRSAVFTGEIGSTVGESLIEQALALKNLSNVHQILVTLAVRELARQQLPEGIHFRDLDTQMVSETLPPQRVFQVLAKGLPSEFPPLRSLDSAYTNLVPATDGFIGREREAFEVVSRLRTMRLVTLVGPAGIGKSRLASQIGRMMLHEYPDGVFLVDFEDVHEPSFVIETIAAELPFIDRVGFDLGDQLRRAFANKQILIILDNCDHVRKMLAKQTESLFAGFRGVDILVTTRQPLGMHDETVFEVPSFDSANSDWQQSYALLTQRLKENVPEYAIAKESELHAIRLCSLLRGVPLAIELVATKLKVLSLTETIHQVSSTVEQSQSVRHEDLQALVEKLVQFVYDALPVREQKVFRRLSAFANGWDNEAAQFVVSDPELSPAEVERCTNILVQKGLLRRQRRGHHHFRDSLVPSLRPFAQEFFLRADEEKVVRDRHLEWFTNLAERASRELMGRNQHQELDLLNPERGNLRLAIEWALNGGNALGAAYEIVLGVHMFWYRRGHYTEGKLWLDRILAGSGFELTEHRARALNVLGVFLTACGDNEQAITYHEHSLDIAKKLGLKSIVGFNMSNLAVCYRGLKQLDKAVEAFEASANALREAGETEKLAVVLSNLGGCLSESERYDEALSVLRESLQLNESLGNEWAVLMVGFNLAQVALRQNALEQAEPLLTQSISRWFEQQDYRGVAMALKSLAVLAEKLDQPERAAVLLGASASLRSRLHQELPPIEVAHQKELSDRLSSSLGDAAFFRKWSEGNNLSPHAAVEIAVGTAIVNG